MRQYGDFTLAYSIMADLNITLEHFTTDIGIIGYSSYKNLWLMLGDPFCSMNMINFLIQKFLAHAKDKGKKVVVVQGSLNTALAFADFGYHATHMGIETILDVQNFDLKGKKKAKIRRWINTAKNAGITVFEGTYEECDCLNEAKSVSKRWIERKINNNELKLMTRQQKFEDEEDTRKFFAYINNEMVGYIVFDPIYKDGNICGYYSDICRIAPISPNGTFDAILDFARKQFKKEGIKTISLGISPLACMNNLHGLNNRLLSFLLKSNYYFGNKMYAFNNLEFHKKAYRDGVQGVMEPKFYITKGFFPIKDLINTFNYIGIVPGRNFLESIAYISKSMGTEMFEKAREYFSLNIMALKHTRTTKQ